MNWIYDLYSNEFFGVILFTVIGVLAVLFILILILGKMDEQKRKKAEAKEEDAMKDVTPEAVKVEVPISTEKVEEEPVVPVEEVKEPEPMEEEMVVSVEVPEEEIAPVTFEPEPEEENYSTSFLGLEEIEKSLNVETVTPVVEEEVVSEPEVEEAPKTQVLQDQFSSVYVTPSASKPEVKKSVPDMDFELPKPKAATPKKEESTVPGLTFFSDVEAETYDIEK